MAEKLLFIAGKSLHTAELLLLMAAHRLPRKALYLPEKVNSLPMFGHSLPMLYALLSTKELPLPMEVGQLFMFRQSLPRDMSLRLMFGRMLSEVGSPLPVFGGSPGAGGGD
jgi:hypothetical protein